MFKHRQMLIRTIFISVATALLANNLGFLEPYNRVIVVIAAVTALLAGTWLTAMNIRIIYQARHRKVVGRGNSTME